MMDADNARCAMPAHSKASRALVCACAAWGLMTGGLSMDAEAGQPTVHPIDPVTAVSAYHDGTLLVDVRSQAEWDDGHVEDSILIPFGEEDRRLPEALPFKNARIVLFCRSGRRAQLAIEAYQALGYRHVVSMSGGFADLAEMGLKVQSAATP